VKVDNTIHWDYFDWANQGFIVKYGVKGVLFLNENHHINFKVGLGDVSKNYVELLSMKSLFKLALDNNVDIYKSWEILWCNKVDGEIVFFHKKISTYIRI